MSVSELSASTQNYVKAVWGLQEWTDEPVTPTALAARVGVRMSSVSDAVRRLTEQGLLTHTPYGAIELTEQGRHYAVAMVRRHRLLETFLVDVLGYRWDQVHDEAETLEHAVSDFMIERIDERLGHPTRDPHGDPIPSPDGVLDAPDALLLSEVAPGRRVRVERISDADPELLQYFAAQGIHIGVELDLREGTPFSEALEVIDGEGRSTWLGQVAADSVWVTPASS